MAYGYVDVNLKGISEDEWEEFSASSDYGVFGHFEGENFEVIAKWNGRIKDKTVAPREFWEPFEIIFNNLERDATFPDVMPGSTKTVKSRKDPSLSGRYKTVKDMMTAYRSRIRTASGDDIDDREIYDSEYDTVEGFTGAVPKSAIAMDEALLEDLVDEVAGDKPDESLYGDGGW